MIAYVYWSSYFIISCKIENVEYINDSDKEIRGESNSIKYGDSQDYIILETDSINLNKDDVINLTELVDHRTYFTKGKDYWYKEQIKNNKETINNQTELVNSLIEMVITTTLPTT